MEKWEATTREEHAQAVDSPTTRWYTRVEVEFHLGTGYLPVPSLVAVSVPSLSEFFCWTILSLSPPDHKG
jgi:hypothetical protein